MPRHVYRCPLRWSDMDAYGHVNNGVFVTLLEEARVDLLLSAAGDSGRYMLDTGVLVKRHEVDYLAPLTHRPEPVTIELWTEQIRPASFVVGYEVKDEPSGGAGKAETSGGAGKAETSGGAGKAGTGGGAGKVGTGGGAGKVGTGGGVGVDASRGGQAPVVYATAKSLLVSFDIEQGGIRRLTEGELEWLYHFHESS